MMYVRLAGTTTVLVGMEFGGVAIYMVSNLGNRSGGKI